MKMTCIEIGRYCSNCPVTKCKNRKEKKLNNLKGITCDGNCYLCDAAIKSQTSLSPKINSNIRCCLLYNVQVQHDVTCIKRTGDISKLSNIEKINDRISRCDSCEFSSICEIISENAGWTIEDLKEHLEINWNFHNEVILDYVPKNKLYAFCICESLQNQFKDLQLKSLHNLSKQVNSIVKAYL